MKPQDRQGSGRREIPGLSSGTRRCAGLALLALATACGLTGLWLFPQAGWVNLAWFLYLCSIVFFATGLVAAFAERDADAKPLFIKWNYVPAGIIVLALALFMRLYSISSIPFGTWFDEADIGLGAREIVEGVGELPVYGIGVQSQPLHYAYLVSLAFRLFGAETLSIRLVSVAFGLLGVVAAFLLGRDVRGARFGLLLAFFMAVGRWHVTFSRLGFITISTPFFVLMTFYFLFRGMRTRKPLDFGLGGLALGLGLAFPLAFRLVLLAVILFFLYWIIRLWRDRSIPSSPPRLWTINLALFLLGSGLAVAPVAQFALREPQIFWERTGTVSIFSQRDEPDLGRAILSNTIEHVLMFNYEGDRNGRHNLPGEPMLDPVSGVLFVLGLGLAISRIKQPAEFTFLILFVMGLSAGIFALDFESPQAQRAAAAMPSVYFFAALAAESIFIGVRTSKVPWGQQGLLAATLFAAGAGIAYLNAHTYFVRQAGDPTAWRAHMPAETLTGQALRELDPAGVTIYLSQFLQDHHVVRFLAPEFGETKLILPPDAVPLRELGDKPVILLVDQEQAGIVDAIMELYPAADHFIHRDPARNPVLHRIQVPASEIRAIQGLVVRYWTGSATQDEPAVAGTQATLEASWPADAPVPLPFAAGWEGILYVPQFGRYELQLEAPGQGAVWLDDGLVIEKVSPEPGTTSMELSQGNHRLMAQATGGGGEVRLSWRIGPDEPFERIPAAALYLSPPVFSRGLTASYYAGGDWDSSPAFVRIEPFIDQYIHLIPLQRPYGVEWDGQIEIPVTGEYEFGLRVNGEARLFVDEALVVDAAAPAEYLGGRIQLDAGRHSIRLRFLDYLGGSRIHLYWTQPGGIRSIVPSEVLFPEP